jgi:hypothetical protein
MRSSRLLGYAPIGCALCGCSHGQSARGFSGTWDDGKTRGIAIAVASTWKYPGEMDFQGVPADRLQRDAYAILPFDAGGVSRKLVLVALSPPNRHCHACAPVTGGAIFIGKNGGWEAGYDQAKIVDVGASGKPPKARLQAPGPALPAVTFETDSTHQGFQAETLTLVGEVAGRLNELLSIETEASNEGAALPGSQTFQWRATLESIPVRDGKYLDIRVKSSGTREAGEGKPVQPFSSTVTYRFSDGSYKPD